MSRLPVFVGIDYHPSVVQVCVKDAEGRDVGRARIADSCAAIHDFVDRLVELLLTRVPDRGIVHERLEAGT